MHPLITAIIRLRDIQALHIRPWSPYFSQWMQMCEEQRQFMVELEDAFAVIAAAEQY